MYQVAITLSSNVARDGIYFDGLITGAKLCIEQVNNDNHFSSMMAPECDRPISDYIYANFSKSSRYIVLGNYSISQTILTVEKKKKG